MRGAYDVGRKLAVRPEVVEQMHDAHGFGNDEDHPSPYQDIGRDIRRNEYAGCATAADLLRWFKGFVPDLLRAGCEIVALQDVTITAVGKYQVLFTFNT